MENAGFPEVGCFSPTLGRGVSVIYSSFLGMAVAAEEISITGPDESRQGRLGVSCLAKVTNNCNYK